MTGHERLYRHLLRLYPAAFRERYGEDLVQTFRDQLRVARASGRRSDIVRYWARTASDLATSVPPERFRREEPMARAVEAGSATIVDKRPAPRTRSAGFVVAFGPVWFALSMMLVAPGFADPLLDASVAFAGLPLGLVLAAAAGLLTLAGMFAVRTARSPVDLLLALLLFTTPAFVVLAFGPAFLLFLRNAG